MNKSSSDPAYATRADLGLLALALTEAIAATNTRQGSGGGNFVDSPAYQSLEKAMADAGRFTALPPGVIANGIQGLTPADIPNLASEYLSTSGGTFTGTSTFSGYVAIGSSGSLTDAGTLNLTAAEPIINFNGTNGSWQTAVDSGATPTDSDFVLADKCFSTNSTCPSVMDQVYDNNNQDGAQAVSSIISGGGGYAVNDTITLNAGCTLTAIIQQAA